MDKSFFDYANYGSIGIAWVLSTTIYAYIGYAGGMWLDRRLGTTPLFLVVGLLLAVALSLRSLVAQVMALLAELDKQKGKGSGDLADQDKNNPGTHEKNGRSQAVGRPPKRQ